MTTIWSSTGLRSSSDGEGSSLDDQSLVELRTRSVEGGRRRHRRVPRALERLLGVILVVGMWQLVSATGALSSDVLAGPVEIWKTGWHLAADGTLGSAIWASLHRVVIGLLIGLPVGVVLAIVAGLSRLGEDIIDSPIQALRFLPVIGLMPLIVLWFGVGDSAKTFLIALGVTFPIYINTFSAVKSLDPGFRDLAAVVGLKRRQLVRKIVLPGALPGFLVGLRISVAVSWLLLVFVEQINATNGLGYLMIKAQTFFKTDVIVVALVVYAVLGLFSDYVVRLIEGRALRWQPGR